MKYVCDVSGSILWDMVCNLTAIIGLPYYGRASHVYYIAKTTIRCINMKYVFCWLVVGLFIDNDNADKRNYTIFFN